MLVIKKFAMYFMLAIVGLACTNIDSESDAYGNFEADEVTLSAETNGRLLLLDFKEGDQVNEGQLLAVVDTTQLSLKRQSLQAVYNATQTRLAQVAAEQAVIRAQMDVLKNDRQRIEAMHKEGAATDKQVDDLNGQLTVFAKQLEGSATRMNSAKAELAVQAAQLNELDDQLIRCNIKSPLTGTVLLKLAEQGELVNAGKPIAKVANINEMYLRAYVSGAQLPQLKIGQEVEVRFDKDASNNQSISGVVSWIASSAEFTPKIIQTKEERVNLVYAIKVLVQNDGRIKIGMPGEVRF